MRNSSIRATRILLGAAALAICAPRFAQSQNRSASGRVADRATADAVNAAYEKYKGLREGKNADYIPALAKVDPNLFGIVLVTTDGKSIPPATSRPRSRSSRSPKCSPWRESFRTRAPCRSRKTWAWTPPDRRSTPSSPSSSTKAAEMNPLVNPGAITTTAMIGGGTPDAIWSKIITTYNDFAGRQLSCAERRLQIGVGDESAQSRDRDVDVRVRPHQERSAAGDGPLHSAVLGRGEHARPGDDGRHAGERREESGDRKAGRFRQTTCRRSSRSWPPPVSMTIRASGSTRPVFRARAASVAV